MQLITQFLPQEYIITRDVCSAMRPWSPGTLRTQHCSLGLDNKGLGLVLDVGFGAKSFFHTKHYGKILTGSP